MEIHGGTSVWWKTTFFGPLAQQLIGLLVGLFESVFGTPQPGMWALAALLKLAGWAV